jgi:hypothetical protein
VPLPDPGDDRLENLSFVFPGKQHSGQQGLATGDLCYYHWHHGKQRRTPISVHRLPGRQHK